LACQDSQPLAPSVGLLTLVLGPGGHTLASCPQARPRRGWIVSVARYAGFRGPEAAAHARRPTRSSALSPAGVADRPAPSPKTVPMGQSQDGVGLATGGPEAVRQQRPRRRVGRLPIAGWSMRPGTARQTSESASGRELSGNLERWRELVVVSRTCSPDPGDETDPMTGLLAGRRRMPATRWRPGLLDGSSASEIQGRKRLSRQESRAA